MKRLWAKSSNAAEFHQNMSNYEDQPDIENPCVVFEHVSFHHFFFVFFFRLMTHFLLGMIMTITVKNFIYFKTVFENECGF